ncbi:MAG: exosortase system-associated protein, TIGR04073 family [Candidatus Omnitrophica bacterium]|nr:exosortase system-associated protein, TIGR04073 family [Candidatus Omnitrophota bacterium]
MKSRLILRASLFAVVSIWAWPAVLSCADEEQVPAAETETTQPSQGPYEWHDKLKRGTVNIITSPVEVARNIQLTSQKESLLSGWTIGLVKGAGEGVVRLGAGTIDLLTFPFNFPNAQKAPLTQPEYVWQKPGVKYV